MIGREQIVVKGIILAIECLVTMQLILTSPGIELQIARERLFDEILISEKSTGLELVTFIK
jgi:hypothetical protein